MDKIAKYIFEAGMLKRVARSGWWAEKVKDPESVAEHSFRTALIAFMLAIMEGKSEDEARKLCTAAVFHDIHETRILDLNKITARYIDTDDLIKKVEEDQVEGMPEKLGKSVLDTMELSEEEKVILEDADLLECAFQAKEYLDIGHDGAKSWLNNIEKKVQTKSAKKLMAHVKKQDSNSWWKGVKKLD
jgi:putative hydrolase of HD superfamily